MRRQNCPSNIQQYDALTMWDRYSASLAARKILSSYNDSVVSRLHYSIKV